MNRAPSSPCYLSALGLVNALGQGKAQVMDRLFVGDTSGLKLEAGWIPNREARVGRAWGTLATVSPQWAQDQSRNAQLLLTALEEIRPEVEAEIAQHGPSRVGVVLGTSTSGMAQAEEAVAHRLAQGTFPAAYAYHQQEIGRPAPFLAEYLGLRGPAITISTACTSSGRAFATARNLLRMNLCDAVIVGGADSLCKLTVNGFSALDATTPQLTNPMSRNRQGINIGEGAALFILRKAPSELALLGLGESSDAHHISAPDPTGRGAMQAMTAALEDAGLRSADIGYLNLHATATPLNDEMESRAVAALFPEGVPCGGTKPLTGHTLGAAAATELAFCWLSLREERVPPHRWDGEADPALPSLNLVGENHRLTSPFCLSTSFAFGGNNLALVVGRP